MPDARPTEMAPNGGPESPSAHVNGARRPADRSYLLRRSPRLSFPHGYVPEGWRIRLRRERRVNASFSGIRSLARDGDRPDPS